MVEPTGSYDDVAAMAIAGVAPVIVAVCSDLRACTELEDWLDSAVPSLGPKHVRHCRSDALEAAIDSCSADRNLIFIVGDAPTGDDEQIRDRWTLWNVHRDRLRLALGTPGSGNAIVILMTQRRMREIVADAPDLLSTSYVMTVDEEPFAVPPGDERAVKAFVNARDELERRHGMTTEQVIRKLLDREPPEIPDEDLNRWKLVAQTLRHLGDPP